MRFAEYPVQKSLALERFTIIYAGLCDGKVQHFAPVVYEEMQRAAVESPDCWLVDLCYAFEGLIGLYPLIIADPNRDGTSLFGIFRRAMSNF